MKTIFYLFVCFTIAMGATSVSAEDSPVIGSVKTVQGRAFIIRDGNMIPAETGQRLYKNDSLFTKDTGALGVILRDDTVLSIGPESKILLEEFDFAPAQNKLSFVARMFKGIASVLTGKIAKLAPDAARFETPVATIGMRGTSFLVKVAE